jgi:hypothetical protein
MRFADLFGYQTRLTPDNNLKIVPLVCEHNHLVLNAEYALQSILTVTSRVRTTEGMAQG